MEYFFFITNALTLASVLTTWVRSYLCLQNYLHSRHPRGVCSIVIPAAYLYAEVRIVFTFHVVSKAHINAYNIVSEAVLISRPWVLALQQCYYLGLCILLRWALTWACRTIFKADILDVFAALLYPRHICMKGVLFSLVSSSPRLISGPTIMSPQQYWYLDRLEYCLLSNALI